MFHQNQVSNSWYGQMSPGQMFHGQLSPWQLESVLKVPRNLHSKIHQNRVSNSWDIANIEVLWGGVVGCAKSFSCLTQLKVMLCSGWVELWLSWGFDKIPFPNHRQIFNFRLISQLLVGGVATNCWVRECYQQLARDLHISSQVTCCCWGRAVGKGFLPVEDVRMLFSGPSDHMRQFY